MPAFAAIASVDAPSRPRCANSSIAASRTASRRSSAVLRSVVTITACKLLLTYDAVKGHADPVDLRLAEPVVQGKREGPLEAGLGTRERPLVAVRAEPMERVGADLRFDFPRAQRREHLVATVDLDDVRLPAVLVFLVRRRRLDGAAEPFGVRHGDPPAGCEQLVEPRELRDPDRALEVRQAVVRRRLWDVERAAVNDSVVA